MTKGKRLMLLGAGELGKEFVISAQRLGLEVIAVDRYPHAPAMQVADHHAVIDMLDGEALARVVADFRPEIIVPEIEAIRTTKLKEFEQQGIQVVPTGIVKIHAPPTMVGVDLPGILHPRVRPVIDPARLDTFQDPVKRLVVDQERIMLSRKLDARLGKAELDTIVEPHRDKEPGLYRGAQAKDLGKELGRLPLIVRCNQQVIKMHRHT